MGFSLQAIHEAHKLYTGPDFPKLIREFQSMGILENCHNLETGIVTYIHLDGTRLEEPSMKVDFNIDESANVETALLALRRNQQGVTDFPTFCEEIARAGIYQWVSDLEKMTCSYYDKQDALVIEETIPSV
jgi:uncharacterized protein YbcV (DUF1398 family)